MNMFARFDENPAMTLEDIKETKRNGRTDARTHSRTHTRTDARTDVKTVYPATNKVCGGYNKTKFVSVKLQIFSYPSVITCVLGAQMNGLIEIVLLSTHNICFG